MDRVEENMIYQERELGEFLEEVAKIQEERQRQILEHPDNEKNRIRWADFRRSIDSEWVPILEEYLSVLGRLWFGEEMRLSGSLYRKELVACPAYVVTHEVFGPMAVFWVAKNSWEERVVPYIEKTGKSELKTELIRRGYRCRVVMMESERYHLQGDDHKTLIEFDSDMQIDRENLLGIFAEVYSSGPKVIFYRWKNMNGETSTGNSQMGLSK